jgi:Protein of unknown function (DUF3379)
MNCLEFRREFAIDPHSTNADFVSHLQECPRCAEAHARALAFEGNLRRALAIDPPPQLSDSILLAQATSERRHRSRYRNGGLLALAASLALAIGITTHVGATPLPALAVDHLRHEAEVLTWTQAVSPDNVQQAFAARGIQLRDVPEGITFVGRCPMGRYLTVHMVMSGGSAPVTVIYIANDHDHVREDFQQDGWRGRSLPMGSGTLVILAENTSQFDRIETLWRGALPSG